MSNYNEATLIRYAEKIERSADRKVALTTIGFMIGGGILGAIPALLVKGFSSGGPALVFAVAGLVLGLLIGEGRALKLRLEAQRTLCAVEQERHLRKIADLVSRNGGLSRQQQHAGGDD